MIDREIFPWLGLLFDVVKKYVSYWLSQTLRTLYREECTITAFSVLSDVSCSIDSFF